MNIRCMLLYDPRLPRYISGPDDNPSECGTYAAAFQPATYYPRCLFRLIDKQHHVRCVARTSPQQEVHNFVGKVLTRNVKRVIPGRFGGVGLRATLQQLEDDIAAGVIPGDGAKRKYETAGERMPTTSSSLPGH